MKELSQHPVVLRATDDINPELLERRGYSPMVCSAFSQKYTVLKETDEFEFSVDKEAQKQLPNIIGTDNNLILSFYFGVSYLVKQDEDPGPNQ